jgi:hypothetical protein
MVNKARFVKEESSEKIILKAVIEIKRRRGEWVRAEERRKR